MKCTTHTKIEPMFSVRCAVHTTRRVCSRLLSAVNKRSDYNNVKKSCQSVTLISLGGIYELHQWSFHYHHDVLDAEDDGCHF